MSEKQQQHETCTVINDISQQRDLGMVVSFSAALAFSPRLKKSLMRFVYVLD